MLVAELMVIACPLDSIILFRPPVVPLDQGPSHADLLGRVVASLWVMRIVRCPRWWLTFCWYGGGRTVDSDDLGEAEGRRGSAAGDWVIPLSPADAGLRVSMYRGRPLPRYTNPGS